MSGASGRRRGDDGRHSAAGFEPVRTGFARVRGRFAAGAAREAAFFFTSWRGRPRSTAMSARVRPQRTPQCCPFPARVPLFHRDRRRGGVNPPCRGLIRSASEREVEPDRRRPRLPALAVVTPDRARVDVPVGRVDVLDLRGEEVASRRDLQRRSVKSSPQGSSPNVSPASSMDRPAAPARHRGWCCQLAASSLDISHTFGLGVS